MNLRMISMGLTILLHSSTGFSYPTERPLPSRIVNKSSDLRVLRDHRNSKIFYIFPKVYEVDHQQIQTLSGQDVACDVVDRFNQIADLFSKTKLLQAQAIYEDQKALNDELKMQKQAEEIILRLEERRVDLENYLNRLGSSETEEQQKIKNEIETIRERIKDQRTFIEKFADDRKLRKREQDFISKSLDSLESDLDSLRMVIVQPAARANLRLRLVLPSEREIEQWKANFGFFPMERVIIPEVIGIELSPKSLINVSLEERTEADKFGFSFPLWAGVTAFDYKPTDLEGTNFPETATRDHLPRNIGVQQTLSTFYYCSNKSQKNGLVVPLSISFSFLVWRDSQDLSNQFQDMAFHRLQISDAISWQKIQNVPTSSSWGNQIIEDHGDPSLFEKTPGRLGVLPVTMEFKINSNEPRSNP